ncbi:bifunctional lysylphosphatidylglycerol flippase/synthetase MprF [Dellaglioa carnosa]|uniref:Phosphatidylglycerol lysyltransferase n=1 Tax=Dellaglioa carnosa TaxID=2995136 RepID=A0ABT4JNB9_9LACO|nr:bifunctional lysylphosphatidylglycerol flippase/synthetase MprF [Dellaglioa carnosa]MCZ2491765.1 bifunctional lysylphosphatidylglycerol flippase/synthetase MprF [Dellaglioa carnosa]MCZ2493183.1 bifunctional lysylphosphatidylglycerol flippase/synthetase MprF [Dellaglioa carnosa]MCZ2494835.1 bifunctional lysylphosphatidylglycerol flippase/synthetase MprF [Dellaglioa carnosa]MDK1731698.1 bifunctional lysylphosphatidylglycerol flippase/synthetase MprF [Dellaglioa carnosa]
MKKIISTGNEFIKKRLTAIKLLFILSVLIFVIIEVGRIFKDINGDQVRQSLESQSTASILLMLVIGFIAVLPMMVYDFVMVKFLPEKYSWRYILQSGWITNTITNIAGFGGLLGASLRANFYSKNASKKQVLFAISKIALFLVAGLSLYCWVSLAMIFGLNIGPQFGQYWVWLLLGGLYFPIVFIITKTKDSEFFADLTLGRELTLILGSSLEWGSAGLFFIYIGFMMNVDTSSLVAVFPLFIIASIIGVVSMIPGGLGSFDVFMILGLQTLGVLNSTAVIWLLFYRLFYYIFPFLVGVALFIKDSGSRINEYLKGLPVMVLSRVAHLILVLFFYVTGVVLLLASTVPEFTYANPIIRQLYPYTFYFIHQMSNIFLAFLMIGIGRGIESKVKRAYWPMVIFVVMGIINTLWHDFSISLLIFLSIILICALLSKPIFYRERFEYSWGRLLIDGSIFAGTFILYTIVGFFNMPEFHYSGKVPDVFLFPSEKIWLSGFLGLLLAVVILWITFTYLSRKDKRFCEQEFPADRVKNVIDTYGGNEVSHLAYLRDKNVYFYQNEGQDEVFFLYQKKSNKLVVMGEPVGNPEFIRAAIDKFIVDADVEGMELVFYEVDAQLTMMLHEVGFDFIKTGEEGFVRVAEIELAGKKRRSERALMNKFEREHYTFAMIEPPYSKETIQELKDISDSWLKGQSEKGFSLGFFDEYYLNQAPIAVINDAEGHKVAFATMMPTGNHEVLSIDLMRYNRETAPSGIMDKIFISLFQQAKEDGYEFFDMGMAPLSNVGASKFSFIEEKTAHLIYEYGYRFYGFQGLKKYKDKYVTEWHPKYISFRKRSSIAFTLLQILAVVNQKRVSSKKAKTPIFILKNFLRNSR